MHLLQCLRLIFGTLAMFMTGQDEQGNLFPVYMSYL
jgi:hypothetical protein